MAIETTSFWGLAVLAALPPVVYYARRSLGHAAGWQRAVSLVLRVALVLLLAAAMCGPSYRYPTGQMRVVAARDVSRSVSRAAAQLADEWLKRLESEAGVTGVRRLEFALRPCEPGQCSASTDARLGTNIALALAAARASLPDGYVGRVVLLSDGNETSGDSLAVAQRQGVPVDVVPLPAPGAEVYLTEAIVPAQVLPGVAFEVDVSIYALGPARGRLELIDGQDVAAERAVDIAAGETRLQLLLTLDRPPSGPLVARLVGFDDEIAENNSLAIPIRLGAKPRVLVLEGQPGSGEHLAAALTKNHFDAAVMPAERMPGSADELEPYALIALGNVPAAAVDQTKVEALESFVRRGGGLLVVGGHRAFTPGGYRHAAIERLLPLEAEAKEKPQSSLALVLVIDVSQSMEGEAIGLARQATRQAIEVLSPRDEAGIIVFADEARWASPILPAAEKATLLERVEKITAGGRTNLYPALHRAYLALREHYANRKHVLLLSDGLSDPADFRGLAERMADEGITVSTVALGNEAAQSLLKSIAETTGGKFYICPNPSSVPRVFAMETASAARSGINDEPFTPRPTPESGALFGDLDLSKLPTLMAFDETKARAGATVVLWAAQDEPLLATHRLGDGTVAAFASDAQPRWAAAWLRWDKFDEFWTRVARHAMRQPTVARQTIMPDYLDELRICPTNVALLKKLATETDGRFDPQPGDVFTPGDASATRRLLLTPWLLMLAGIIFVIDTGLKRTWQ